MVIIIIIGNYGGTGNNVLKEPIIYKNLRSIINIFRLDGVVGGKAEIQFLEMKNAFLNKKRGSYLEKDNRNHWTNGETVRTEFEFERSPSEQLEDELSVKFYAY